MSECHPQSELHDAREIILSRYLPKVSAAATAAVGRIKLRVIEAVEELCAELGAEPLTWTKLSVLEHRKVEILGPVVPYVRLRTRIVAVAVICRAPRREYGRVKPVCQPLVQRAGR